MAENKLYAAVSTNDAATLHRLLETDPFLLDRITLRCSSKTPLHLATMRGNLEIVREILKNRDNQILAEVLDSQQSSPLHIASAKGYSDIAKLLLSAAPAMCFSRDFGGRNPIHLAAMEGHDLVLAELIRVRQLAAREKLNEEIVNAKDNDGDTIMHMALRHKHVEIIKFLVGTGKINLDAENSKGQTVIDMLHETSKDGNYSDMRKVLQPYVCKSRTTPTESVQWLTKKRDSIMVVAILIATMAFQAGVSPPGGLWQDDLSEGSQGNHNAGESVMSHRDPKYFRNFIRANTIAFVSSLSIILLLISGLPFKRRFFMWCLVVTMWQTVTSIAITYGIAILAITPKLHRHSLSHVVETGITVWCVVMGILLVGNLVRLIAMWLERRGTVRRSLARLRKSVEARVRHGVDGGGESV
ncbi:ankyrin repeat-containing protein-like [Dorcoceras hygrometricum]|uniref:Ankyrin repeat-containing protein-like n=1 Tax=Dorcoceras hygrometricum TaxID=472368 RepID=A0A2Z7CY11_9LAMI|nr:ankyrin repeat-containing protein-like [Dorcoceras hygrometricum]